MAGSLDSAWAKWDRARKHKEALDAELSGSMPGVPWACNYPVTAELQPSGLEYRFYVDLPPFDGERYALIAGDCLFNLRSALDHLVFALHERQCGGKLPANLIERTQFPILTNRRRDTKGNIIPSAKWRDIGSLSIEQQAEIEFLQPYNARNDNFSRIRESLADLATLNNIDKHRYLHVVRVRNVATSVPWFEPNEYGFRHQAFWVSLVGKTEVFRWTFDTIPPDIAQQVKMNSEITAGVSLDERGQQMMLLPRLDAIIDTVEATLKRFAVFLP